MSSNIPLKVENNDKKAKTNHTNAISFLKFILIFLLLVFLVLSIYFFSDISLESLLSFTPKNYFLAVLFILLLFTFKGIINFFPVNILLLCTGFIFPLWLAFIVNTLGILCEVIAPYTIGYVYGQNLIIKLFKKFDFTKITSFQTENSLFFSYILRIVVILPYDLISYYLGATKINFKRYLLGSMLGILPKIISITFIGANITKPSSIEFKLSLLFYMITTIVSIIIYKIIYSPKNNTSK